MIGYARPDLLALTAQERDFFGRVYCGLCGSLGRSYGVLFSSLTNYDSAFLSLLVISQKADAPCLEHSVRCPTRLYCRSKPAINDRDALGYGASIALLLAVEKVRDTIRDGGLPFLRFGWLNRHIPSSGERSLLRLGFPLDALLLAQQRQAEIERYGADSLTDYLVPSGRAIAQAFAHTARLAESPDHSRSLAQLGDCVGRLVCLADACEDLRSDLTRGRHNPLQRVYSLRAGGVIPITVLVEVCCLVARMFDQAANALHQIEFAWLPGLVTNVVSRGLPRRVTRALQVFLENSHWDLDGLGTPHVLGSRAFSRHGVALALGCTGTNPPEGRIHRASPWLWRSVIADASELAYQLGYGSKDEYLAAYFVESLSEAQP